MCVLHELVRGEEALSRAEDQLLRLRYPCEIVD